jgi:peptide/nickel transport system substrate-binding protein
MRINKPYALFLDSLARSDCGSAAVIHKDSLNPDGSWKAPVGPARSNSASGSAGSRSRSPSMTATSLRRRGARRIHGLRRRFWSTRCASWSCPTPRPSRRAAGGRIDVAEIVESDIPELSKSDRVKVLIGSTGGRHAVLFQTTDPLFKSVTMRQAIAAAIDVNQIVAVAADGPG